MKPGKPMLTEMNHLNPTTGGNKIMSTTETEVAVVEADVVDDEVEADESAGEDVDAEVVSDEVEDDTVEAAEAAPKRRGRPRKNADEATAVQNVPAPAPVEEKSSFTRAKATKLVEKLKGSVEASAELFIEAYKGRIWLALDHASWADFLNAELGELRPRLPKAQRLELVASLKTEAKMSQTAIADALGVDQKTVSTDLRELREQGNEAGSQRSVGQDNKEYGGTREGVVRTKSFEKKADEAFGRLDKAIGDLTELTAENEYEEELGRIASKYRSDVGRAMAFLGALRDAFDTAPGWDEDEADSDEDTEDGGEA